MAEDPRVAPESARMPAIELPVGAEVRVFPLHDPLVRDVDVRLPARVDGRLIARAAARLVDRAANVEDDLARQ